MIDSDTHHRLESIKWRRSDNARYMTAVDSSVSARRTNCCPGQLWELCEAIKCRADGRSDADGNSGQLRLHRGGFES